MRFARLFDAGGCMAVIIPAQARRKLGWLIGNNVTLSIEEEKLVIRNAETTPRPFSTSGPKAKADALKGATGRLRRKAR